MTFFIEQCCESLLGISRSPGNHVKRMTLLVNNIHLVDTKDYTYKMLEHLWRNVIALDAMFPILMACIERIMD